MRREDLHYRVGFIALTVCAVLFTVSCAFDNKNETEAVHLYDAKSFACPEELTMSVAQTAGITSLQLKKSDGTQYALIIEERDQKAYNKQRFYSCVEKELGRDASYIDQDGMIETENTVAIKAEYPEKLVCYINAKNLKRNATIALFGGKRNVDLDKRILHSYFETIGEPDTNYMYSGLLVSAATEDTTEESTKEDEKGTKLQPNSNSADKETTQAVTKKSIDTEQPAAEQKEKTADDYISVIDKSASHEDEG